MKKIAPPKDWRNMPRGRISAGYEDISGADWQRFLDDFKEHPNDRPIVIYKNEVLDGWQRLRAHIFFGIQPTFVEFVGTEAEAEAYVQRHNDNRRHETRESVEQRVAKRRERVATMRQEGMSQRAIAEKEGVSRRTVERDLEAPGGAGAPPEPENAEVQGKDGKSYTLKRCDRCTRRGPQRNCPACLKLRNKGGGKKAKKQHGRALELSPKEFNDLLAQACGALDKIARAAGLLKEHKRFAASVIETGEHKAIRALLEKAREQCCSWVVGLKETQRAG